MNTGWSRYPRGATPRREASSSPNAETRTCKGKRHTPPYLTGALADAGMLDVSPPILVSTTRRKVVVSNRRADDGPIATQLCPACT
jgi:hypothetical protein